MSNYPAGAENDPDAPWNLKEPVMVECECCEGTGWHESADDGEDDEKCDHCDGVGEVENEDQMER